MLRQSSYVLAAGAATLVLAGCGGGATVDDPAAGGETQELTSVTAGYVGAMDQIGLPAALDAGFFEEQGLDVELSQPFPTGVDSLNALQSGEVDFVQVGTPTIGAILEGMDLVYLGNYTGSSTQLGIDETMALVSAEGSGIEADDPSTLRGKRIGVSIGSINHLYMLGLLEDAGMDPSQVEFVNTSPPDMGVALETDGIDAGAVWDPWPIRITNQVDGAYTVTRGGGHIPFVGYIVAKREFVEQNRDVVERFLTARAAADQWMRKNPDEAAQVATRWLSGTEEKVATEAMQHNIQQLDPRFSACNYLAMDTVMRLLEEQGAVDDTFDVNDHFMPGPILSVMDERPGLFSDLEQIPQSARISADYTFEREAAQQACPSS